MHSQKESAVELFVGTFYHQIDAKNRIRIPAKFRALLGKDYYFVASMQGCIRVYSSESMTDRLKALTEIRSGDPAKLKAKRLISSSTQSIAEDDQGRTVIPASLKKHAGIEKDVVTIGMSDYIEIWAKEVFEDEKSWTVKPYEGCGEQMTIDDAFILLDF